MSRFRFISSFARTLSTKRDVGYEWENMPNLIFFDAVQDAYPDLRARLQVIRAEEAEATAKKDREAYAVEFGGDLILRAWLEKFD